MQHTFIFKVLRSENIKFGWFTLMYVLMYYVSSKLFENCCILTKQIIFHEIIVNSTTSWKEVYLLNVTCLLNFCGKPCVGNSSDFQSERDKFESMPGHWNTASYMTDSIKCGGRQLFFRSCDWVSRLQSRISSLFVYVVQYFSIYENSDIL